MTKNCWCYPIFDTYINRPTTMKVNTAAAYMAETNKTYRIRMSCGKL